MLFETVAFVIVPAVRDRTQPKGPPESSGKYHVYKTRCGTYQVLIWNGTTTRRQYVTTCRVLSHAALLGDVAALWWCRGSVDAVDSLVLNNDLSVYNIQAIWALASKQELLDTMRSPGALRSLFRTPLAAEHAVSAAKAEAAARAAARAARSRPPSGLLGVTPRGWHKWQVYIGWSDYVCMCFCAAFAGWVHDVLLLKRSAGSAEQDSLNHSKALFKLEAIQQASEQELLDTMRDPDTLRSLFCTPLEAALEAEAEKAVSAAAAEAKKAASARPRSSSGLWGVSLPKTSGTWKVTTTGHDYVCRCFCAAFAGWVHDVLLLKRSAGSAEQLGLNHSKALFKLEAIQQASEQELLDTMRDPDTLRSLFCTPLEAALEAEAEKAVSAAAAEAKKAAAAKAAASLRPSSGLWGVSLPKTSGTWKVYTGWSDYVCRCFCAAFAGWVHDVLLLKRSAGSAEQDSLNHSKALFKLEAIQQASEQELLDTMHDPDTLRSLFCTPLEAALEAEAEKAVSAAAAEAKKEQDPYSYRF